MLITKQDGWRTVVVDVRQKLCLRNECIVLIREEEEVTFPIAQVAQLIVLGPQGSITIPLLNALAQHQVAVLFCDEKRNPACELVGIDQHGETAGCLMDQAAWTDGRKMMVWAGIVQNKLDMQISLLENMQRSFNPILYEYQSEILPGDVSNREGLAAKLYFDGLFGAGFVRHQEDDTNAALDYGYAILRSCISRVIALHGYHPALGIHHESRTNPANLSCDLMEPFRPFVDKIVYLNRLRTLSWEYKKELIAVQQENCFYGKRNMNVQTAINCYVLDVLKHMKEPEHQMEVIRFA